MKEEIPKVDFFFQGDAALYQFDGNLTTKTDYLPARHKHINPKSPIICISKISQ